MRDVGTRASSRDELTLLPQMGETGSDAETIAKALNRRAAAARGKASAFKIKVER
ncbi:MAG: hypothetical protein JOZ16_04520 [Methylobacteriaceae bacterium]|nr:hypothetical protein [Methylobacteriaceae bacterium]